MEEIGVIDLQFDIEGEKTLLPVNWKDLTETLEYGQNSNQPSINAESFTFQGDSANHIFKHFHPNGILKPGNILVPLKLNLRYRQHDNAQQLLDDYIIDPTKGVSLNSTSFNNKFSPNEVVCNIRQKNGSDYFLTEIQGLTWGLLLEEGAVTSSDYTTIKTVVVPLYNFLDIITALLAIYSLQKQFRDSVDEAKQAVIDTVQRVGAAASGVPPSPVTIALTVVYQIALAALKIAAAILLLALIVKLSLDMILLLLPPVLKNKGITLRRGMEIICDTLGYDFVSNLPILDKVVYMPSGAHSEGKNLIKNNLPNWFGNTRGVPNDYDRGYICVDFLETIKKLVNGRVDVEKAKGGKPTVYLRNEDDQSLFVTGGYKHRIDPNYTQVGYNIQDIPHTRLISFPVDDTDLYTIEYQESRMWEVKNISNPGNLPFTKGEYIEFEGISLARRKEGLNILEKIVAELAGVADKVAGVLGQQTKLEEQVKGKRTGCVMVSQNNFSNPKLVPIVGDKMPSNYQSVLSAQVIEQTYYVNRSIVRGTGQKIMLEEVEVPMSLADRDKIKNNGNFQDEFWGNCTFKKVEYQYSRDTAICDISVDSDYIAQNTFTEKTYNGS
jgi:hypothetical protein